jgi:hypothetical protein
VTSEVAVIGVAPLMRTDTSKASFCRARLCSSPAGAASGFGELAEADVDVAVAAAQALHHAQEPAEALFLLGCAALLGGVSAHVLDLVVGDRDGDQHHVVALSPAIGIDHVGEQAEARRQQLARAGATALQVPLQGEAFLDQKVDVVAQDELVDRVVLEAAADEEDAAAPHDRAHGEEVHVDAAGGVVRGVALLVERVLQHQVVEVRLVRRKKHQWVSLGERLEPRQLSAVVLDRLAVALGVEQVDQVRGDIDHEGAVGGGDLAQVARGVALDARARPPLLAGEAGQTAAEGRLAEDVLVHQTRHLVAIAAQPPFAALERERCLTRHEFRQPPRLGGIGAAGVAPARAKLRGRRGLARHDAAALRLAAEDPALAQRARVAGVAEAEQVRQSHRAPAIALLRQPRDAQWRQQHVAAGGQAGVEWRQRGGPRAAARRHADRLAGVRRQGRRPIALDPGLQDSGLELTRGVEQEDRAPPVQEGPRRLGLQRLVKAGSGRHRPGILSPCCTAHHSPPESPRGGAAVCARASTASADIARTPRPRAPSSTKKRGEWLEAASAAGTSRGRTPSQK